LKMKWPKSTASQQAVLEKILSLSNGRRHNPTPKKKHTALKWNNCLRHLQNDFGEETNQRIQDPVNEAKAQPTSCVIKKKNVRDYASKEEPQLREKRNYCASFAESHLVKTEFSVSGIKTGPTIIVMNFTNLTIIIYVNWDVWGRANFTWLKKGINLYTGLQTEIEK
jgi:hypothetical protein